MPTYLLHGFRWPRNLIRIHIILQNLDDAAAEWLMAPATVACIRENFRQKYGNAMQGLPDLQFIEQFDVETADKGDNVQPYAYVADVVEEIKLGVEVGEIMGRGVPNEQWASITELRDQIAPGEKVGWFVVVCQDTERLPPSVSEDEDEYFEEEYDDESLTGDIEADMRDLAVTNGNGHSKAPPPPAENGLLNHEQAPVVQVHSQESPGADKSGKSASMSSATKEESIEQRPTTSRSVKKWFSGFGALKKAKSLRELRKLENDKAKEMAMPPPLPGTAV
ncbi:hypothetical protein DIS24_g3501 [Lasiodiplodia hormozganensis]|uniref:Developmental regulator protein n=1 Tax=Lasiodiplodia hormozganensis TaxID=869390 RepID=A0AA39YXL2_9PEZI|nr:hypothetical protein DIS24_g3501 [Lasiodiplodia hormozganensis]